MPDLCENCGDKLVARTAGYVCPSCSGAVCEPSDDYEPPDFADAPDSRGEHDWSL